MSNGWIGIDFDGTLAEYHSWPENNERPGAPIPPIVDLLRGLLAQGEDVRIFTARASDPDQKALVEAWLASELGLQLEVTNVKDFGMIALYDDRAVQVEKNTGRILGDERLINF